MEKVVRSLEGDCLEQKVCDKMILSCLNYLANCWSVTKLVLQFPFGIIIINECGFVNAYFCFWQVLLFCNC